MALTESFIAANGDGLIAFATSIFLSEEKLFVRGVMIFFFRRKGVMKMIVLVVLFPFLWEEDQEYHKLLFVLLW